MWPTRRPGSRALTRVRLACDSWPLYRTGCSHCHYRSSVGSTNRGQGIWSSRLLESVEGRLGSGSPDGVRSALPEEACRGRHGPSSPPGAACEVCRQRGRPSCPGEKCIPDNRGRCIRLGLCPRRAAGNGCRGRTNGTHLKEIDSWSNKC